MNSNKKTARIVGVLFITATVAVALSLVFLATLFDPDYLVNGAANENQILLGVLLLLIGAFAIAMIPVLMFPIFKGHNEALALGYVVFRVLEAVVLIVGSLILLSQLTLSQEYVEAGAPDASSFQTLGTLLQGAFDWTHVPADYAFGLGSLILSYLLYQSRLVPRWLSVWGLIGATLVLAAGLLGMFGLISPFSTIAVLTNLPIALFEMVLAVWLIIKGFNSSAIAPAFA